MTKILLSGCCGKMGRTVTNIVNTRDDCQIVAGVDIVEDSTLGYPVFQTFSEVQVKADVIVDFSNPAYIAASLPKFLEKDMYFTLSSFAASSLQILSVLSFEPSFTNINSKSYAVILPATQLISS